MNDWLSWFRTLMRRPVKTDWTPQSMNLAPGEWNMLGDIEYSKMRGQFPSTMIFNAFEEMADPDTGMLFDGYLMNTANPRKWARYDNPMMMEQYLFNPTTSGDLTDWLVARN